MTSLALRKLVLVAHLPESLKVQIVVSRQVSYTIKNILTIDCGFSGMVDFKSVHGAPEEIFHFEVFQILKLVIYFEGFLGCFP